MAHKIEVEKLREAVKNSLSFSDVCRFLNIKPVGSNVSSVKKWLKQHLIDFTHFTGAAWNQGERFKEFNKKKPLTEICIKNSTYFNTDCLRRRLIKEGVKEFGCEECKLTEWNNKPISLELHHNDGDRCNNELINLTILCPNCHAQTDTYCSKKRK